MFMISIESTEGEGTGGRLCPGSMFMSENRLDGDNV